MVVAKLGDRCKQATGTTGGWGSSEKSVAGLLGGREEETAEQENPLGGKPQLQYDWVTRAAWSGPAPRPFPGRGEVKHPMPRSSSTKGGACPHRRSRQRLAPVPGTGAPASWAGGAGRVGVAAPGAACATASHRPRCASPHPGAAAPRLLPQDQPAPPGTSLAADAAGWQKKTHPQFRLQRRAGNSDGSDRQRWLGVPGRPARSPQEGCCPRARQPWEDADAGMGLQQVPSFPTNTRGNAFPAAQGAPRRGATSAGPSGCCAPTPRGSSPHGARRSGLPPHPSAAFLAVQTPMPIFSGKARAPLPPLARLGWRRSPQQPTLSCVAPQLGIIFPLQRPKRRRKPNEQSLDGPERP